MTSLISFDTIPQTMPRGTPEGETRLIQGEEGGRGSILVDVVSPHTDEPLTEPTSSSRRNHIALVGMYGGMWKEYNPGCYMIGYKTHQELQKRIPGAEIDIFSIDNKGEYEDIQTENLYGLPINYFSRRHQMRVLNEVLPTYDALVIGGDIVWGGDDVAPDNDIFFLNSEQFQGTRSPVVVFNAVHTFYTDENIDSQREKLEKAVGRAAYTSVRTEAIRDRLQRIGIEGVQFVPDPVLDLDPATFKGSLGDFPLPQSEKSVIGVSIREKLFGEIAGFLESVDLSKYAVLVFPYSRQYRQLETVMKLKDQFGTQLNYAETYLNPFESFDFIGKLDTLVTDTYHGLIAAIIQDVPVVSLDVEEEATSRKEQLFRQLGMSTYGNIRLAYNDPQNTGTLVTELSSLIPAPLSASKEYLTKAQSSIRTHYDTIAQIISRSH